MYNIRQCGLSICYSSTTIIDQFKKEFLSLGGQIIQKECDERVKKKGALSEGEVFISTGGNLQCKFVAHAVGPHWHGGNSDEEKTLQHAVVECFEKSEKKKACSIAIPALSAGVFQYPIDKSCMAIVEAIFQYTQVCE